MKKQLQKITLIAIMLFVFQMMLPQLMAQPIPQSWNGVIGSVISISTNGSISYWNGTTWVAVVPVVPGQSLQFVNGTPTWINNPNGISTNVVTNNTGTTATTGGTVISDGGAPITARGVCWGTTHNPTLANSFTTDGTGISSFTSNLTSLTPGTIYYVRAYATNSMGTTYATEVSFTTTGTNPLLVDFDGNVYDPVTIGTQTWMKQNLNVTHYRNGDAIPNVTDNTAWSNLTTGAYSDYNNNPGNSTTYGRLYNWYTVVDTRNLCPTGWHVPSDAEWTTLTDYLGGLSVAGGKLKEAGLAHWISPNTAATNETGFTALPAGYRFGNGTYGVIGYDGSWWSSTEGSTAYAWYRNVYYDGSNAGSSDGDKRYGFSVRCLKD